jgi:ribonucleoside-diphosphate reductase alpha chain
MKVTPQFTSTAQIVLCKRYLRHLDTAKECSFCHQKHETSEEMFERCSFGREDYYNLLASLDFLPNSPTLFNGGTEQGTLSGCFKFNVDDSMVSILEVGRKAAMTLKYGGGTGYCLSALRPYGAQIRSTHGKACGPVAVLRYYHAVAQMITQGGKREGAQMAVLSCEHTDVRQFIHCKDKEPQSFDTFNLSVACTNKFMESAEAGTNELFKEMCESAWKTGDPGIYFIDTSERSNPTPWLGKLDGTNACGEVPALDNEPCNLGSINLSHMIVDGVFDYSKLTQTVRLATDYLDEVIDQNFYPDEVIEKAAKLTRKVGLGVMGWADTLALLHIHYDTQEAVDLGSEIIKTIQEASHNESAQLAAEKGNCPAFIGRALEQIRRNATTTCIAPAGTISVLASCSSGIEPHYTLEGSRAMGDGTRLEDGLRSLKTDFIPHTAHEIGWKWHIAHQAAFQQYTDLAVSKTVNMKESATIEDFRQAFLLAWESGCKGITIYRDKCRNTQVIVDKGDESRLIHEAYKTDPKVGMHRRKMTKDADAKRHGFSVGGMEGYLHTGLFPDGTPGEVFITGSNQGSTVSGLLASLAIVTSMALQYGVPLESLVSKLQNVRFEPSGATTNPKIPVAPSVVGYIFQYLDHEFIGTKPVEDIKEHSGMLCPECGAEAVYEEGCLHCSKCDWSRCG